MVRAARGPPAGRSRAVARVRPAAVGAAQDDFEFDLGPEVEFNPVLREYLRSEQGIEVDGEALGDLAEVGNTFDPYPAFAALEHACARVVDFSIAPRLVLGTFSYAKLPMVADLALQGNSLADHDVVAALAGDEQALAAVRLRLPQSDPDPDPEHEHLVLDADSSQQAAIEAVRAGAHLVVKGPPGTGKSQTIANLVCTLAAEGKSVLFVAEKRAAIDAVLHRLDRLGLSDLVLDAYDGPTNRRATAQQFVRTLSAALEYDAPAPDDTIATLRERRTRLQRHVDALHRTREPWGVTAHQVQQALVELGTRRPAPLSHVRLASADLGSLSRARAIELARRLRDAVGLGAWTRADDDPWFGARILTQEDAVRALDITSRRGTSGLDEIGAQLNQILAESRVPGANSVDDWSSAFHTMATVSRRWRSSAPRSSTCPSRTTSPPPAPATGDRPATSTWAGSTAGASEGRPSACCGRGARRPTCTRSWCRERAARALVRASSAAAGGRRSPLGSTRASRCCRVSRRTSAGSTPGCVLAATACASLPCPSPTCAPVSPTSRAAPSASRCCHR